MKKLLFGLAAAVAVSAAVPANAQGIYFGAEPGYRGGWWGGPGAHVYVYPDRPRGRRFIRRYHSPYYHDYGYGHRTWGGGY